MSDTYTSNDLIDSHLNVGILGGTFNPPHRGHLMLANSACHAFALDKVLFVVAGRPWQKLEEGSIAAFKHRFRMTELALKASEENNKKFIVSDVEKRIGGNSYTSKTISYLRSQYPSNRWFPIIGADVAAQLDTWRETEKLRRETTFIVANRPSIKGSKFPPVPKGWNYRTLEMDAIDISSSLIRESIERPERIESLLPSSVLEYMQEHKLYGYGQEED